MVPMVPLMRFVNHQIGQRSLSLSASHKLKLIPKFIEKRTSMPSVAVLNLTGMIQADSGKGQLGGSKKLNLTALDKSIDKAFSQKRLKSVLLNINSPGGSPVQSELIGKKIIRLSKQKNVKVISFVEDLAASGGYWLACAGDEIYVSENSIVGSIGVISARLGLSKFIRKYDVDWRVHTSGKSKAFLDPFQPEKEDDVKKLKIILNAIHQNFINYVKERRGSRLNADDETLFNGDVWLGQQAVANGLVDGIDDISSFINEKYGVIGKDVNVIRVNAPKQGLLNLFGSNSLTDIQEFITSQRFSTTI